MFRVLRLIVLGLTGYMAYEFIQGLRHGNAEQSSRGKARMQPRAGGENRAERRAAGTMTGPGQGQRVRTEDASGAGGPHVVGRGVV